MLIAHNESHQRILATLARREERYTCPECTAPVIVKRGSIVTAHFAHVRGADSCLAVHETEAHMEMKLRMYQALKRKEWIRSCDLEVPFQSIDGERSRRADVWAMTDSGTIVIECQVSPLTIEELEWNVANYTARNVFCLYVVHRSVFGSDIGTAGNVTTARVPRWVQWLHDVAYSGRVYVYDRQPEEASRIVPWHLPKQWGGRAYLKTQRWVQQQASVDGALPLLCERIPFNHDGSRVEYAIARFQDPVTWSQDIPEAERQREYLTPTQRHGMYRACLDSAKHIHLRRWIAEGPSALQQRLAAAQEHKRTYEQAKAQRAFPDFERRRELQAYFESVATVRTIEEYLHASEQ